MRNISNTQDIIDSRDIIAKLAEMESELENWLKELNDEEQEKADEDEDYVQEEWTPEDWEDFDELKALRDLNEQGESYPDWTYGETLISDSYFKTYAMELADDIGATKGEGWPNTCIDWDQAARELQMDYSIITFDGEDYWIRA